MKLAFAIAIIFLAASAAQAQSRPHPIANSGSLGSGGISLPSWGSGGPWSGINSPTGRPVAWEPPREFSIDYATNDGPNVPSVYMSYEDALALGKQQLAAAQEERKPEATVSLGEAAHILRTQKLPTFRLRTRVLQDNDGKLHICNLNGNDCRRI